jgi:hypothetical protein
MATGMLAPPLENPRCLRCAMRHGSAMEKQLAELRAQLAAQSAQLEKAEQEKEALWKFVRHVDEWAIEADGGCSCERCQELRAARRLLDFDSPVKP